ncbi:MAG: hypothetical protein DMG97_33955 [Acidobacteria bacterium]|nr:MAG: hypothetical protein DMG97_33955 [Acidobacteriota bacterium]
MTSVHFLSSDTLDARFVGNSETRNNVAGSWHSHDNRWLLDRHNKRIGVRFLDFCYQIFAVWQECPESATLFTRVCSPSNGSMDIFAMVADSKVFIVARNKHVVPKRRRVERLPSGYSVRESRDDSHGSYWYVVTALDVVPPRNA